MASTTIRAAGVLCWRETAEGVRVLLVKRPDYGDVSIPKGKVDPGELLPQTAARELLEETGIRAVLGAPIGSVRYQVNGRPKFVQYWAAEVLGHQVEAADFTPNDEISAVVWVTIPEARRMVSYPHDKEMLATLAERLRRGSARTFSLTVLRHGKALAATSWDGPDPLRPLLHRGLLQAEQVAASVAAYGPRRLWASPAVRCVGTIAPLADRTGLAVRETATLTEEALDPARVERFVGKRLAARRNAVLCSHAPVIPELVEAIRHAAAAHRAGLQRAAALSTADFAVFHLTLETERPHLVEVEVHSPTV